MTRREQLFADHYLCTLNATDAARKAGYSENSARQQGYENLTKPYIKKYIQERSESVLEKLGVTQERVLAEIAQIAFADITDLFENDWGLKEKSDIPSGSLASIKNLTKTETGVKVEMYDKLGALLKLWELVK